MHARLVGRAQLTSDGGSKLSLVPYVIAARA